MPRMKLKREEFDPKKLDVKIEKSKFKRYTGDIPRTGTILIHRVTKMWWTQTEDGTSMIKGLAVAEQNEGKLKQYNGLPTWAYLVFKPDAAFTYVPFLQCFGLTTRDIFNKLMVAEDADSIGDIIEAIADWEVGSDDALCRIVVKNDREYGAKVDREGWLPLDEADEVDDEDEDDIDEDEDEEDEPPARPTSRARGRSSQDGRQAKSRRRAEPEPEEDEDDEDIEDDEDLDDDLDEEEDVEEEDEEAEEEDEEEEEPPARTKRGGTRSSRTAARPASSTHSAGSGRSRPARDGSRARSGRTPTSRAARDERTKGSKADPPF